MTLLEVLQHVLALVAIGWLLFVAGAGIVGLEMLVRWLFS